MQRYVLGLDIGETSIGWALVGTDDNDEPTCLLDSGVRIFQPGAEIDERTGSSQTKCTERRVKRSARRIIERRRRRKEKLKKVLQQAQLLPSDRDELTNIFARDPYELRASAIKKRLEPFEIGRVIYHMCQRRGFFSNRKSEKVKKETGEIKKSIQLLNEKMSETGAQTLGEYLFNLSIDPSAQYPFNTRLRDRFTDRKMYKDELDAIWNVQAVHYPSVLTEGLKQKVYDTIFFQRSYELTKERLKSLPSRANARRAPQLGTCSLIPKEKRCPVAFWSAQQFRLLKEVNNLRILDQQGGARSLMLEERKKLIENLSAQKEMSFSKIRKLLKVPSEQQLNLEAGKRDKLKGNIVEATCIKAFGNERWGGLSEEMKNDVRKKLVLMNDEEIREQAQSWGLEEDGIKELVDFIPPEGYLRFSEKAINILIPYLENGFIESEAIDVARKDGKLPHPSSDDEKDFLPTPDNKNITNPIVLRCMHEARKVINAIIREYGKPAKIVVELARNVKANALERQSMNEKMRQNEELRNIAKKWYEEHGRPNPSGEDILRYKLWDEQRHECPYTGKPISEEHLLSTEKILEIDHILPLHRSGDDSQANKVLCFAEANHEKGDRTPYEWKGGPNSEEFKEMMIRVKNMNMPDKDKNNKLARFYISEIPEDFISRQLNDTRYASRLVVKYLWQLFPKESRVGQKAVYTTKGEITSDLRRFWGLNHILGYSEWEKNREDHRQHAVDAVVIACTNHKHVHAWSNQRKQKPAPPWENFRNDVKELIVDRERTWKIDGKEITTHGIIVSHCVDRKISGAFHKETNYGPTAEKTKDGKNVYVYRKPLTSLTGASILEIRDPKIKEIVINHCKQRGFDPEQNSGRVPTNVFKELPVLPVSEKARKRAQRKGLNLPEAIPIKKVRLRTVLENPILFNGPDGKPYRAVIPGNNHHIEIVETTDKKGRKKWEGEVVTMLEAARRARITKEPIVKRDHGEGKKFVMSLSRNESVFLTMDDGSVKPYRVLKMDTVGRIDFCLGTFAGKVKYSPPIAFAHLAHALMEKRIAIKVNIDPLGRVYPAHD